MWMIVRCAVLLKPRLWPKSISPHRPVAVWRRPWPAPAGPCAICARPRRAPSGAIGTVWLNRIREPFGSGHLSARQHRHQDLVIAVDLDEGHAFVDQPRDHIGKSLRRLGDKDGSVGAEGAFPVDAVSYAFRCVSATNWLAACSKKQSALGFLPAPPCQIRTRSRQQLPKDVAPGRP